MGETSVLATLIVSLIAIVIYILVITYRNYKEVYDNGEFYLNNQLNLLRASNALNLRDFTEYFKLTRRVTTNKPKIIHKALNLQHLDRSRYDSTDLFRFNLKDFNFAHNPCILSQSSAQDIP